MVTTGAILNLYQLTLSLILPPPQYGYQRGTFKFFLIIKFELALSNMATRAVLLNYT